MIETKNFKSKSEILERKLPRINGNNQYQGKTVMAMDIGYSTVKIASPERVGIFPSYVKKAPEGLEVIGRLDKYDLQFRDNKTGTIWLVGQSAESLMEQSDIDSTTDASLYTRYRYDSDVFKVLAGTGLALGLWGTGTGNEIFLQTGLPATYKDRDEAKLRKALVGEYDISLKVGNGEWTSFEFSLDEDHIFVMEQPQGTLCATAYENGEVSKMGFDILRSNSIILDIGFGTEDIFSIRKGYKNAHQTYSDTGMRAVFEATIKSLEGDYKIFEFQKYLEDGVAPYLNMEDMFPKMEYQNFTNILEEKNRQLCEKSILRLMQEYGNLIDYKYLIVTGGTGESRFEQIKDMLKGLTNLKVLPGNINCNDLAFCYSNVIGYYMLRHATLQAEIRKMGH